MDDNACLLPKDRIMSTLKIFNKFHPKLQFTTDIEKDNTLPFLDTLIVKDNNQLKTRWYRKPSNSNRLLNYKSFCPKKHKLNLITGLKHRILNITHPHFVNEDLTILKNILQKNSYPTALINKILFSTSTDKPINPRKDNVDVKYKTIAYIPQLSNKIKNLFHSKDIHIAYKTTNTVSQFFTRLKDRTKKLNNNNVVYLLQCLTCGVFYVGQTKQRLQQRLTQHSSDVRNKPNFCALSKHIFETGHQIDFKQASILFYESDLRRRQTLETIAINKITPNCNSKSYASSFSKLYISLLPYINIKLH